jgi:hypothetical protein
MKITELKSTEVRKEQLFNCINSQVDDKDIFANIKGQIDDLILTAMNETMLTISVLLIKEVE